MVPPTTPEVTAQQHGVDFTDSPSPSGVPETGSFQRDGVCDEDSRPIVSGGESGGSAQPAASTPVEEPSALRRAPGSVTASQVASAQRKIRLIDDWQRLVDGGRTGDDAITVLRRRGHDVSRASIARWMREYAAGGFDALIDRRRGHSGRRRQAMRVAADVVANARRLYLISNRTKESGSVPEAMRAAARQGLLPPEIASEFRERERDGRGVPASLRRQIISAPAVVRQHRNPTDAGLDYVAALGSTRYVDDPSAPGGRRPCRVGDFLEADDASINFCAVIPWEMGGCKCSEKYGVKVGRFQWLVAIDRCSLFVPGWSYTARPRQSYRAEDIVSLFGGIFRQHGVWQRLTLEQGAWASDRVEAMLVGLGIERSSAWSPHGKPYIEGLFNLMWTKQSLTMNGQVGRFRGEEEATQELLRSCQAGATDPRLHFPLLGNVLSALRLAVEERNSQPVHSKQYGSWVPQERWLAQQEEARSARRLRPLPAESAWLFAPTVRDWTVRRGQASGSVQIVEGWTLEYSFAADWMPAYEGHQVRVHFDPSAPRCEATVVLLENCGESRAGDVLGTAWQSNENASYARMMMGWGADDRAAGLKARAVNAAAMRREVRTVLAGGGVGYASTEIRDGVGREVRAETTTPIPQTQQPIPCRAPAGDDGLAGPGRAGQRLGGSTTRRAINPLAPSTPEEFRRKGGLLAKLSAATRAVDAASRAAPVYAND